MRHLDRLLLAALTGGVCWLAWHVELMRHEATDKRIDDAALALQAWGKGPHAPGSWADMALADVIERRGGA